MSLSNLSCCIREKAGLAVYMHLTFLHMTLVTITHNSLATVSTILPKRMRAKKAKSSWKDKEEARTT